MDYRNKQKTENEQSVPTDKNSVRACPCTAESPLNIINRISPKHVIGCGVKQRFVGNYKNIDGLFLPI